jgi:hypothetical protein
MSDLCSNCSVPLVRSRRKGRLERYLLAPIPVIRPFRCPNCLNRALRFCLRPTSLLLFLIAVLIGLFVVQSLWDVGSRARDYRAAWYEPKDMERAEYLEKKRRQSGIQPDP